VADLDDVGLAGGRLEGVPTLVFDPQPAEFEQLLERRHRLDQDRRDEVWEGVLYMIPPASHAHERMAMILARLLGPLADAVGLELTGAVGIGVKGDYRVPDLALHRPGAPSQWHPTAALVVEIISPRDKTWDKVPFYAAHQVDELLIVDPQERKVHWLGLQADGGYRPMERSGLIPLGPAELAARVDWPQ
jgi:Uma2 family endonuclease